MIKLRQMFSPVAKQKIYQFRKGSTDEAGITRDIHFAIKSITDDDFGVYNCTVANAYGTNSFIFEIQPISK